MTNYLVPYTSKTRETRSEKEYENTSPTNKKNLQSIINIWIMKVKYVLTRPVNNVHKRRGKQSHVISR